MTLNRNVGTLDSLLRLGFGLLLVGLALVGTIGAWGWIGVVPIVTALVKVCPAYSIIGLKTCKDC